MKNLRELAGNPSYYKINREERNVAAIFYHLLLQGDNLKRFLKQLNYDESKIIDSEVAVYYEYAFIRDLWNSLDKKNNETKRDFILNYLGLDKVSHPSLFLKYEDFNRFFGAKRALSTEHVVSPANWSIDAMDHSILNNEDLLRKVCYFKWGFNAKPDIVIHTSKETAICIEAKWGSNEGTYTATDKLKNVNQTDIQNEIMTNILDIETEFCFLVKKRPVKNMNTCILTWNEVFENLDRSGTMTFAQNWIDQICLETRKANKE